MWYDVVERLDPARFTAHLLDFRGTGLSDRPAEGHDLEGYAADLRAALAAVGPAVLVGHSMGGKVGAVRRGRRVRPRSSGWCWWRPARRAAAGTNAKHRALTAAAFGSRARIERFQRGAMTRALGPAVLERIVEDALIAQREHWFGWYDRGRGGRLQRHGRPDRRADRGGRRRERPARAAGPAAAGAWWRASRARSSSTCAAPATTCRSRLPTRSPAWSLAVA